MKILNLTDAPATPKQKKAGVVDEKHVGEVVKRKLDWDSETITSREMEIRAIEIASFARGWEGALISGEPVIVRFLEQALLNQGVIPMYDFSRKKMRENIKNIFFLAEKIRNITDETEGAIDNPSIKKIKDFCDEISDQSQDSIMVLYGLEK